MTSEGSRRAVARRAGLAGAATAALVIGGCAVPYDGGYSSGYSSGSSSSYSSTSSAPAEAPPPQERSYVVPNKDGSNTIIFKKPGETTVVRPDGGVTIIQRDADGTRTYVDSHGGVKVVPPGSGRRR